MIATETMSDAELYRRFLDACAIQGLALHVDPIFEESDEQPQAPSGFFMFGQQPVLTEKIRAWRAYLMTQRRDGEVFVATGPTAHIAVRALWSAYTVAREGAYRELAKDDE